jgi:hypothetical protein
MRGVHGLLLDRADLDLVQVYLTPAEASEEDVDSGSRP